MTDEQTTSLATPAATGGLADGSLLRPWPLLIPRFRERREAYLRFASRDLPPPTQAAGYNGVIPGDLIFGSLSSGVGRGGAVIIGETRRRDYAGTYTM